MKSNGGGRILSAILKGAFRGVLGARPATLEGEIRARGIRDDIVISRDRFGVPSIVASSDDDGWFGLGFCHGQDRAGQLEILIRTVRGTLAEIAGEDGLPIDRLSRRLGFRRVARAQLAAARPEIQAQIKAFALGVNAGTSLGSPSRAHDLVLLGCDPTPFEAEDAQGIMVMLCFALASNWDVELLRLEMLERDGPDAVRALDARYPAHLHSSLPPFSAAGPSAERLAEELRAVSRVIPLGGASNAWAVSGKKTKSGRPILAADPHLEPVAPPHWHLAHVVTPSFRVRGACFTGIPGFALGHNERVAWGVTAAHVDNTDLFLEEIGPDGKSVRQGDGFVACEERLEAIAIRGERTIVEKVLVTPRGPIVGPAFDGARVGISISATWLSGRSYAGLLVAHKATSARDLHEKFREASASSVTVVAADVDGHVGWQVSVEVPERKRGHGLIPLPAWEPDVGWKDDLVPFESLPRVYDPEEGFIAAANNAPDPIEEGAYLGADFLDGYRHRVLVEALAARNDWDRPATQALQKSTRSIPWEEMRDVVLAAGSGARGHDVLRAWDGKMSEDSAGASVFALFVAHLARRIVEVTAPNTARRALGEGFNPMLPHNTIITRRLGHLVELVRAQPTGMLPEGWAQAIRDAIAAGTSELERAAGADPAAWGWGRVRPIRLQHLFSRVNPVLDHIFGVGPFPFVGDSSTVVQGIVDLLHPLGNPLGVPNLRMFIDVGDFSRSRFSLLGGQSGNPLSRNYADQVDAFFGDGLELAWTDVEISACAKHRLRLLRA